MRGASRLAGSNKPVCQPVWPLALLNRRAGNDHTKEPVMPLQKDFDKALVEKTDEVLYNLSVPSYDYLPKVMTVARREILGATTPINQQKQHSLKNANMPYAANYLPCLRSKKS